MAEIPPVDDFEIESLEFRDARSTPKLRAQVASALLDFVASDVPPRDLLCNVPAVNAIDRERATLEAWQAGGHRYRKGQPLIEPALLEQALEKSRAYNLVRHTAEIFAGDLRPLSFGIFRDGVLIGAWQWYAIRVIPEKPAPEHEQRGAVRVRIRCGWFPVLFDTTPLELANRSVDLVEAFVKRDRMMRLADGRMLDIVQATAPTLEVDGQAETEIIRFARERLEQSERLQKLKLSSRTDPTQPGRKRLRITALDVEPIDEPEIEELERGRA